jgi:hypothetical protein
MKIYHTVDNVVTILAKISMCKIICRFVDKSLQQSADFSAKIFAARYAKQISEHVFQSNIFSYAVLLLNTMTQLQSCREGVREDCKRRGLEHCQR